MNSQKRVRPGDSPSPNSPLSQLQRMPPPQIGMTGQTGRSGLPVRGSLLTSIIFHGILLLVMAMIVISGDRPSSVPAIETTFRTEEVVQPDLMPVEPMANPLVDTIHRPETSNLLRAHSAEMNIETKPMSPQLDDSVIRLTARLGFDESHRSSAALTTEVAIDEHAGKTPVRFFGIESIAKSYVFIVDASGSMRAMVNPRVNRFRRAVGELRQSLEQLSNVNIRRLPGDQDAKFFIIFYNANTFPIAKPQFVDYRQKRKEYQLIPVTEESMDVAYRWIQTRRTARGTLPANSLRIALSMKPDIIYFLTDGEIPGETRRLVRQQNKHDAVIHTICIGSVRGQKIMKAIAADSDGEYRFVP